MNLSDADTQRIASDVHALLQPDLERFCAAAGARPAATSINANVSGAGRSAAALPGGTSTNPTDATEWVASLPADIWVAMKERLDAFGERLKKVEDMAKSVIKGVTQSVCDLLHKQLAEPPVSLMTDRELHVALKKAFPTAQIRKDHALVLEKLMLLHVDNPNDADDILTVSLPPASQLLDTFANENFKMICIAVQERLLIANASKPMEKQPHVVRGKTGVDTREMDKVDYATDTLIRGKFHDPRCVARKLFYVLFAYYLVSATATMQLTYPEAEKPTVEDATGSDFFSVTRTLQASCSGLLPDGEKPAAAHKHDAEPGSPLVGIHSVSRKDDLLEVAAKLLAAVVRSSHTFQPRVLLSTGCILRNLLVSTDRAWLTMPHKDAEEVQEPGVWTLMTPRPDARLEQDLAAQQLTAPERNSIISAHRALAASVAAAAATTAPDSGAEGGNDGAPHRAAPEGGAGAPSAPSQRQTPPTWLRSLAH